MAGLSLDVLGPFQAHLGTAPLPGFRTQKVQALLVYLVIETDPHSRESLMTLLWPGLPERSARGNLRQIIYYLRKMIPEVSAQESTKKDQVPLFIANRSAIQLNSAAAVEVDAHHFEDHLQCIRDHDHFDLLACSDCRQKIERAVELYRGNFLEDFYLDDSNEFEEWAQVWQEAYRRKALDALEILTTMNIRHKEYPQARTTAERQLEIDNLREPAYRQLMQVAALSGQRSEALAVYERCRRLLAEELGMAPSRRTTELYERILAGELSFDTSMPEGVHGYELKDEIGEGAYGTIHLALQPSVGREVAVKVVRRRHANDPEFIRRFEAEAQTVARLEHPHIVPLYDYWRDPDGAYLVMRFLRGGSLLSSLESGPWELGSVGRLLDQIAGALTVAHCQGVVHRDIKPANILFDEAGNAYLSDFGIAKDLTGEMQMTVEGAVIGTPDYISPEQILNDPVTPQSDIYSLGAVIYETLTGEKPFPDSSVANLIYKHLHEPVPLVGTSRPDLPPQIDEVIQRATAKRPADRYADALEMAKAFRKAVEGSGADSAFFDFSTRTEIVELYNPYKGLRAFQEADAADFFGRDALVEQLISQLSLAPAGRSRDDRKSRFLAVVGPSGSGKSSVVKAGLIPALRDGALPGSDKWFVAEMVPGSHPLEELELALWPIAVDPPPSLVEPMERDTRGMLRTIRRILPHDGAQGGNAQLLLVIDQFEELFTLADEKRRDFFIDSLLATLRAPRSPLWVVVTLRADFFDRPLQYESLGRLVKENSAIVLPLTAEELAYAVSEPARRVGVSLERGLESAIIADIVDQPGALPLMQYALTELFEKRQGSGQAGTMTRSAYVEIGGVLGALGQRADEIYGDLDPAGQEAARQLFLRLVTLGEGVEDTRRRVLRAELESMHTSDVSGVIDSYGTARLLTFDHDPMTRQPTVEVAHEALLREWARLRQWLNESRDDIRQERAISRVAEDWDQHGRDESFLLRGTRLDQAAEWGAASTLIQTPLVEAFIAQSLLQREKRRRAEEERLAREARLERNRRTLARGLIVVLSIGLVVALALTYFAFSQRNDAEQSAAFARAEADARATAEMGALSEAVARATAQAETEGEAQARATAQAEAEGEAQARATAQAEAETQRQSALDSAAEAQNVALVAGSQAALAINDTATALALAWQAVALNPNSALAQAQLSEVAYAPGTVRILSGNEAIVNRVYVSPDGQTVFGVGTDGVVILWDMETGQIRWQEQAFTAEELAEAGEQIKVEGNDGGFSPDGQVVAATFDDRIMFWAAADGQLIRQIDSTALDQKIEFSPTGDQFVTIGKEDEGRLVFWDFASGEAIREFDRGSNIEDFTYTADGSAILLASQVGELTLLDAQTGDVIYEVQEDLGTSAGPLFYVDISPDGSRVITNFSNAGVLIWDLATGEVLHDFRYGGGILAAAFHPQDGTVLTSGQGGIKTIDPQTGQVLRANSSQSSAIFHLAITTDGNRAVTTALDGTVRLWDLGDGQVVRRYPAPEALLFEVALSPDGQTVLIGSTDGSATLLDVESGEEIWRVEDDQPILAVAFSPNGRQALTGAGYRLAQKVESGHIILWDVETGQEIRRFEGHPYAVFDVDFSPDGRLVASAGNGAIAILWDVETGQEIRRFEDYWGNYIYPDQSYWSVEFSPDGQQLFAAHSSGPVIGWDVESGQQIQQLEGHTQGGKIVFSEDGQRLVSGSADSQAILWDVPTGSILHRFEDHASGVGKVDFSPDETFLLGGSEDGTNSLWQVDSGEEIRRYGGGFVFSPNFSPDGHHAVVGFRNGAVELWRIDSTLDELLTWTRNNRYIPELTCEQRKLYGIEPLCE